MYAIYKMGDGTGVGDDDYWLYLNNKKMFFYDNEIDDKKNIRIEEFQTNDIICCKHHSLSLNFFYKIPLISTMNETLPFSTDTPPPLYP